LLFFASAGCSSSASSAPQTDPTSAAAQGLAAEDGGKHSVTDYTAALTALATKCSQDVTQLANMVAPVMSGFEGAGISDEDHLSILQHVAASIPDGTTGMDCIQQYAAYETLREQG
jgi:hypothetical protein